MQFDTKVVIVVRTDLAEWQKLNVTAFLASGIAASAPEAIGEPYEDGSGTTYLRLLGQPILIYGAERSDLARARPRPCARGAARRLHGGDVRDGP
jgi:hypothetical protein